MPHREKRAQLELPIQRIPQADRNHHRGGRSFYFFDFDDNVMHLPTPIYVFHRQTRQEVALSTGEFARVGPQLGHPGPWQHYEVDADDHTGSFRRFRDAPPDPNGGGPQFFVEDLRAALERESLLWKGPSWEFFHYAVFNGRPLSIITARGHRPAVVREGIRQLVTGGHVQREPRYLTVLPVSHPEVRLSLGDAQGTLTVPELKRRAILRSVEAAMQQYGESPHHRFGMSDDDSHNVALIVDAMTELKRRYPSNPFFVIDTSQHPMIKTEVLADHTEQRAFDEGAQLGLFG